MQLTYDKLIEQTFYFPQEGFRTENNELQFYDVPLMEVIKKYGTPLRITYLPRVSHNIQKAKNLFNQAIADNNYKGKYHYCYCTKSNHFSFILEEALKNDIHIETSSAYDIDLIRKLYEKGLVSKNHYYVHNGMKPGDYLQKIAALINDGFRNVIPVLDNTKEIDAYGPLVEGTCNLGIRIAAEEEPEFDFYTSRLGIRSKDIISLYQEKIKDNPKFQLKMLHFFINTGIKDTTYYWSELSKAIRIYTVLKKQCPELDSINIGGGFPIKKSLGFEYDYEYMIREIVKQIKQACVSENVPEPDIFTEFGSYTVGESGALIFTVLQEKLQNDSEAWYMINGSMMATLPDIWGLSDRFILLPVNKWQNEYQRINVGGLSCDQQDYYNAETHHNQVYLPKLNGNNNDPLHIGFFHIGAYQEALSGYGGIKHCLLPSPKHVLINKDKNGALTTETFAQQQNAEGMMKLLGY